MDELVTDFLTEANEGLVKLDACLTNLRNKPCDRDPIHEIFRILHTIKGTCSFLDFPHLHDLLHQSENTLADLRDDDYPVAPSDVARILECVERIKQSIADIEIDLKKSNGHGAEAKTLQQNRRLPIGKAWEKLPHIVRDLALKLDKQITLEMVGEDIEVDQNVIELIKYPLMHMVRNSCDHGIEPPALRIRKDKPECGNIILKASRRDDYIVVELEDDGQGISMALLKETIINNKLANAHDLAAMSDEQIQQFIFKPGFSTAHSVTYVSGRGVGMDVVFENIKVLGGSITFVTQEGAGSTFIIRIPTTPRNKI